MTDKEIYQQIEEYSEEAGALYEKIHERVEASIIKHVQEKKRRKKLFASILSAATAVVLVVTLAIVLPIVLQPQDEEIRYNDAYALLPDKLNCNLKEYNAISNISLLYLDRYEYAEDLSTVRYYEDGKEGVTVYLSESFTDGNSGYGIQLSIMKRNIVIESLDARIDEPQSFILEDTQILYILNRDWSWAKFEYQGYKYYLEIDDGVTLDFLLKTIQSMFNN